MSAPARIVTPPFATEQVLQWSARATGAFARAAALACLIASTGALARHSEIGPAGISIGDKIAVLTFLGAACFWRRGRGVIALFGGVVTLAAAWSGGYLAQPATRSALLGLLGLLLLVAATASEELWGPGLGTPRPRARVAAVWVLGGLAMTYVVGFASLLVLGSTGTTTASTLPALSSDTSGPLLLVCVLLGLQFTAPFFSAKLRVTTLGPRTGAICFVTEASYVALCWGLAVAFFTWRIALPTTLPLIAMVMGAVAWAGLARFAPEDPWSRIGLGLHALLVVAVLVFCVYVVATAAGRGQVVQTATGTLVSIGLLILAANPLQKAIERSSDPGP